MSLRKVSFEKGEYYHIYNRGNSKQVIFNEKSDYNRFLKLLYLSNNKESFKLKYLKENNVYNISRESLVSIGAYCLMPNHFHLLLTQKENGSISKFMQKLSTGYSMYYNIKYERSGSLFEGKFKSKHAENDEYLKYLYSYIHLNPVKIIGKNWKEEGIKNRFEATKYIEQYPYSSYPDYLGSFRYQNKIINPADFPDYFTTKKSIGEEIFNWLNLKNLP